MGRRRVVITGMGALTPVGHDLETSWEGLLAGRSGAGPITRFDASRHSTRFACEITGFEPEKWFSKPELRRYDIYSQYGLVAAEMAMRHSGLDMTKEDPTRVGCILGTGIGGIFEFEATKELYMSRGPDRVSPFFIPKMISNALAGQAAMRFNLQGTCYATVSACASSNHAIGAALRAIQYEEADVVLTGGAEAATTELGLAGFCALKALSTRNDEPKRASRPFDLDRDGFVMGEGAVCLVLEDLDRARRRGATIHGEILGFGSTDDAFHITAPRDDGDGAVRAMRIALRDAGIPAERVRYVNAHGTSTPLNDKIETLALKKVFGEQARSLQISSTKSMTGHLLGAAGALGVMVAALTVTRGHAHPTINLEHPDPECDLDYIPNQARDIRSAAAICNALGFGGHNTSVVVGRFEG
ncbi:MAG: beta-ketoacyl-ACP synthase II [Planctomycetes bacterium]|nr:beta-ketoacyl-ACP synthase II [Planctomycetota bacterium]